MKKLATFENKLAILTLVKIIKPNGKSDRILVSSIKKYKRELKVAIENGDAERVALYREEIGRLRKALVKPRPQTYVWVVFLKQYNQECQVEIEFDSAVDTRKLFIKKTIDEAKHQIRGRFKLGPFTRGWGKRYMSPSFGSKDKGHVFAEAGAILKAHVQKNMKLLLDCKVPALPRRYIGIELEFCAPIKEELFALKLFQKGIHKYAQLKQDGSLRPKDNELGFELAILLEESNYKKGLKQITDVLAAVKATAKDRRCGLHVHMDMRRRDKNLVYNNMVACQYALLSIVDPSRYNNEFCRVVKGRKFPTEFTGERQERYKTINAAAYYKYRTLEIRMHEGSVDYNEISNWVDLLVKLTNHTKHLKTDVTKLPLLNSRLKLKKTLYNYALERSCSFQVQNEPNIRHMREDVADLERPAMRVRTRNPLDEVMNVPIQPLIARDWHIPQVEQAVHIAGNGLNAFLNIDAPVANAGAIAPIAWDVDLNGQLQMPAPPEVRNQFAAFMADIHEDNLDMPDEVDDNGNED